MKILFTILALIYALSPYDVLPDLFAGWGWLDDLFILFLLWRFFYAARRIGSGAQGYRQFGRQGNGSRYSGADTGSGASASDAGPRDPYTVLGLSKDASAADVKQAYRALANQYHPDKVSHLGEEFRQLAERRFKEIQEAYQALQKK